MASVNKALFLDRDGVVNEEGHFVHTLQEFRFIDGIFDICRKFQDAGYMLFIITNQSGIARGMYDENDFRKLTGWIHAAFLQNGIKIDRTYHCPYHPEAENDAYRKESFDRKPNPGMILKAQKEFQLDLGKSVLVGDRETDIQAGKRAGVGKTVLFKGPFSPERTQADLFIHSFTDLEQLLSQL